MAGKPKLEITPTELGLILTEDRPIKPLASHVHACHLTIARAIADVGIRLVVWDFDLTILRIHSFATRLTAADVAGRDLRGDFCDLDFFVELSRSLVNIGVGVAIASVSLWALAFPPANWKILIFFNTVWTRRSNSGVYG
jgi:hypothetical protein